jgi:hypothetical protein
MAAFFLKKEQKEFLKELEAKLKAIPPSDRPTKDLAELILRKRIVYGVGRSILYYFHMLCFFGISVFFAIRLFSWESRHSSLPVVILAVCFFVVTLVGFVVKYKRLELRQINVSLTIEHFDKLTAELAAENNWDHCPIYNNFFTAGSKSPLGLKTMVTIVNTGNQIFYNSICDPDEFGLTSLGTNSQNMTKIKQKIEAISSLET